jgi:hypothetical protein
MRDATRQGVSLATKQNEKEPVSDDDEKLFWGKQLLGMKTAKTLLNTVYYYNGKLFGLRGGEHRNLTLQNFELGPNFIKYQENVSKTFHGGLKDLKYEPKSKKHICHDMNGDHDPCILELYRLYIGLIQFKEKNAFYFRPRRTKFEFEKSVVGINTLNQILPSMCKEAGIKVKTAHCLRVTCATKLFNAGVPEKMIRERTGHRSSALHRYEKPSENQCKLVSNVLGSQSSSSTISTSSTSTTPGSTDENDKQEESNAIECSSNDRFVINVYYNNHKKM